MPRNAVLFDSGRELLGCDNDNASIALNKSTDVMPDKDNRIFITLFPKTTLQGNMILE